MLPDTVTVQERVGYGRFITGSGGRPCCAVGHALKEVGRLWDRAGLGSLRIFEDGQHFEQAYLEVAAHVSDCDKNHDIISINDAIRDPKERARIYNATWARLGYTRGQCPRALRLARRVEHSIGPFKFDFNFNLSDLRLRIRLS